MMPAAGSARRTRCGRRLVKIERAGCDAMPRHMAGQTGPRLELVRANIGGIWRPEGRVEEELG